MAGEHTTPDGRPHYGPRDSGQTGPDERESVIGDNDLPMRAAGPAGESAGSGVSGLGGSAGGTPTAGGVGLPGGNRRLGAGPANEHDASASDIPATDSLGTGRNVVSGIGDTPPTEVLPGGATRSAGGQPMDNQSDSAAANEHPAQDDEIASRASHQGGLQRAPLPAGADTPVPDATEYDADTPMSGAASRSTPENPVPEEPTPGLMDYPGPEAEI